MQLHKLLGSKQVRDNVVIATKFAAYPWRVTPNQFVDACRYDMIPVLFYVLRFMNLYAFSPLYIYIGCLLVV